MEWSHCPKLHTHDELMLTCTPLTCLLCPPNKQQVLRYVSSFSFSEADMVYLRGAFPPDTDPKFFEWLEHIDTKDILIYAMPEGSVRCVANGYGGLGFREGGSLWGKGGKPLGEGGKGRGGGAFGKGGKRKPFGKEEGAYLEGESPSGRQSTSTQEGARGKEGRKEGQRFVGS